MTKICLKHLLKNMKKIIQEKINHSPLAINHYDE